MDKLFREIEKLSHPATILWRSIEVKLVMSEFSEALEAKTVLDLGCGEGFIAKAVFDKKLAYGLDSESEMVRKAQNSGVYQKVLLADASVEIPLPDESVELVFSNSVLEHIENVEGVFDEVVRVLKVGGSLVFTAPTSRLSNRGIFSSWGMNKVARVYGEKRNRKYEHKHLYLVNGWKRLMSKKGLKVHKYYYYLLPETVEWWDRLLWWFSVLKRLMMDTYLYPRFYRNKIFQTFLGAKPERSGVAVAIWAKKNNR